MSWHPLLRLFAESQRLQLVLMTPCKRARSSTIDVASPGAATSSRLHPSGYDAYRHLPAFAVRRAMVFGSCVLVLCALDDVWGLGMDTGVGVWIRL